MMNDGIDGERQGNLASSAIRTKGKTLNFALPAPDPATTVALASVIREIVCLLVRQANADRLVAEIGPWMLADRKRRATCEKSSS